MERSTIAADYQDIARSVSIMAKDFQPGAQTGWHSHLRHQMLYAVSGLMTAQTERGSWIVPAGFALWIVCGTNHNIEMPGAVSMRTVYVSGDVPTDLPEECCVFDVSELLKATVLALLDEPLLYDIEGRGGHLEALLLDEVSRASATPFSLPMPRDARLARLCRTLADDPGVDLDLDAWADRIAMSRRTLTRHFRVQTGMSFAAWRRRLRLLEAAALCAQGESLSKVCARLGYQSLSSFRAMARREFGTAVDF